MKTSSALRFLGRRVTMAKTKDGLQKKIIITAAPIVIAGLGGLFARMAAGKRNGALPQTKEEITELIKDTARDIDRVASDLKLGIQDKSASQLEKSIDATIKDAKEGLDRIAAETRKRLRRYETAH